ncbi:glycogen debranching protein GlgX [Arthrobacter sp. Sa2BUA2]|uniref:Glycogen debranching protein GlgX n=1 Tax=Arthrobacter pullicola TaxID=2762224 RepID=A0ABR8YKD5_9MICC|nr:glycogen debranching protein GlgX [Arthrobacter pullicola]MBD8044688.1 glycogen debranching protein GlgX [Arthrobacter pullicola]
MAHVVTSGRLTPSERVSRAFPLGVHSSVAGVPEVPGAVNVSVYAPGLDAVDVWFETAPDRWTAALLERRSAGIHHGRVDGFLPGVRYGFWPHGAPLPADPGAFQLLLDPYGRGIGTTYGHTGQPLYFSVATEQVFDWGSDQHPHIPWRDTVVYETHVRGMTMLHPDLPEALRGTYAGMGHPAVIRYLLELGITAVELLPVHFHIDEPHLQDLGLSNYWGYNTLGFFSPHAGYATAAAQAAGPQTVQDEVKAMVKALHQAGLEVILDVVYNHTAEGAQDEPALCWRGLGDEVYYRHSPDGRYLDTTGCGNTLDFSEPRVIQLALDSLRYWVSEFHVDGFRFDLAPTLARDAENRFDRRHPLLVALAADPVMQGIKLIAEPWDLGPDGWQTGNFPPGWADWNDHFRDTVRDFWLVDQAALAAGEPAGSLARLGGALAGSAELFARSDRTPLSSLNLVTAHDGFTMADLTAYNHKHNEANGEDNRDGSNHNRSWNHGIEGPSDDPAIQARRAQTARNLMATLLFSVGVPMITAGDEIGRSQHGNNNSYCQDNRISWLSWDFDDGARRMLETTRRLLRIRREFLAMQPYAFPADSRDAFLLWFSATGEPMTAADWHDPGCRVLQLLLGSAKSERAGLVVINGQNEPAEVVLPDRDTLHATGVDTAEGRLYELLATTADPDGRRTGARLARGETDRVAADSISVYRA